LAPIGGRPEGLSRAAIIAGCERSLERLGLTTIDLYYLHAPDPHTPIDESLEALAVLRERGLIAGWGVSNHASWQVLELIHAAPRYALPPPAASQVIHNLLVRQIEIEHLAFAQRYQVEVITYNPLAGGLLADHHDLASGARGAPPAGSRFGRNKLYQRRYWTEQSFRSAEAYRSLAAEHRLTLLELAYRFASQAPGVAAVLIGPASTAHLEAALEACNGPLAGELTAQLARLHTSLAGTDARYAR
jgi:aryl-alcohol dehydrogenase-like predicted oxidoreductase